MGNCLLCVEKDNNDVLSSYDPYNPNREQTIIDYINSRLTIEKYDCYNDFDDLYIGPTIDDDNLSNSGIEMKKYKEPIKIPNKKIEKDYEKKYKTNTNIDNNVIIESKNSPLTNSLEDLNDNILEDFEKSKLKTNLIFNKEIQEKVNIRNNHIQAFKSSPKMNFMKTSLSKIDEYKPI